MATEHGHLSGEVGHTSGPGRVLLTIGMVSLGLGVAVFFVGLVMGMADARGGGAGEASVRLFGIGGMAAVAGLLLAAVGMTWARHDAGE